MMLEMPLWPRQRNYTVSIVNCNSFKEKCKSYEIIQLCPQQTTVPLVLDTLSKLNQEQGKGRTGRRLTLREGAAPAHRNAGSDLNANSIARVTRIRYLHITSVKWAEEARSFQVF